jgi:hypothetical protein
MESLFDYSSQELFLMGFVGSLILLAAVGAQQDAADGASVIRSFVSDTTLIVGHLDINRLDVQTLATRLLGRIDGFEEFEAPVKRVASWVSALRDAGAKDLYVLTGLTDFPNPPTVVVPLSEGANAEKIGALLCGGGEVAPLFPLPSCATIRNAIVAGAPEAVERARQQAVPAPGRAGLPDAIASLEQGVIGVAVSPTDDERRVLEELVPNLPKELGGKPITSISQGLKWASLTLRPGEAGAGLAAHLIVQARDADSAEAIRTIAADSFQTLKQSNQLSWLGPDAIRDLSQLQARLTGDRLTLDLPGDRLTALLAGPVIKAKSAAKRSQSANNLKQIMLAMHNYISAHGTFPPAFVADKAGKPLLSWRVLILPYIEEEALYKEFHLDEPWDSPHNKALVARMPAVYRNPSAKGPAAGEGMTTYLAPRGKSTVLSGPTGVKLSDVTDGTSNTITVVEFPDDRAVVWTKPEDWEVPSKLDPGSILSRYEEGSNTAIADGSVLFLRRTINPDVLQKLLTRDGGEVIGADEF